MKVFIDGKEVECLNDVKIIHDDKFIDFHSAIMGTTEKSIIFQEVIGDIHITLNDEGMIADIFKKGENDSYKTMWKDLEDIVEEIH